MAALPASLGTSTAPELGLRSGEGFGGVWGCRGSEGLGPCLSLGLGEHRCPLHPWQGCAGGIWVPPELPQEKVPSHWELVEEAAQVLGAGSGLVCEHSLDASPRVNAITSC